MGANLPFGRRVSLEWLEAHIEQWSADPAAIGLTAAQIGVLATRIINARSEFSDLQQARTDARARTQSWHTRADALHEHAADLISAIKAFADNNPDGPSGIYQTAGLTQRRAATPLPAPERPGDLRAALTTTGSVELTWDGRGPTGTVYIVRRRLPGETSFAIVGQSGGRNKKFTDATVPAGTAIAMYSVQAVRGEQSSAESGVLSRMFGNLPKTQGELGIAA